MMVKSFLAWMDKAPARERAEAVDMLARAYLAGQLGGDRPQDVEAALTSVLDDPSVPVRRALAMAFADRPDVPRHIVLSLASDHADVSGLLIARSPLLSDADLVDLAVTSEGLALVAIALRPVVSARVASAIVRRGVEQASRALIGNLEAEIADGDLNKVVADFGQNAEMRELLLRRAHLPASVRHGLMVSVAQSLGGFVAGGGFLSDNRKARLLDETIQTATLDIATRQSDELAQFVAHLRQSGHLTPSLLLRSVLGGNLAMLGHALAELAELDLSRVTGLLQSRSDAALSALLRRGGLPDFLERPFIAAIRASHALPRGDEKRDLCLPVIRAAQSSCIDIPGEQGVRLLALLRRYEAEAARAESRRVAEDLRNRARAEIMQLTADEDAIRLLGEWHDDERIILPGEVGFEENDLIVRQSAEALEGEGEFANLPQRRYIDEGEDSPGAQRAHIDDNDDVIETASARVDEPMPDLRTLIAEWKAERGMSSSETSPSLLADLKPGNDAETWTLRGVA